MSGATQLDLTQVASGDRLEKLLAAFDGLKDGQSAEVATGPNWDGLLETLQAQRPNQFEWLPLEKGADRWLGFLLRTPQTGDIVAFMIRDHRRCDEIYADMEEAGNNGDAQTALTLCNRFLVGMEHHFNMEEKGLFPAFENRTGMRQGPTMVMRMEHEQMRNLLGQMGQCSEKQDLDGLLKAGGTLLFLMQQHNVKEEQMLYPMTQAHLMSEAKELIQSLQRL